MRRSPFARLTATLVIASMPFPGSAAFAAPSICYRPPVSGQLTEPFIEPPCPYCAGHRGLEFRVPRGSAVRAVASGTVSFSGIVVDVRYIVVDQDDGLKATYGMLEGSVLGVGETIHSSQVLGTTGTRFYFGLRDDGRYIDPQPLLGVERSRVRLVPIGGQPRRPTTFLGWSCLPRG